MEIALCVHVVVRSQIIEAVTYIVYVSTVHDIMHPVSDHLTYVPLARLACSICQGTLPWQPNNVG